MSGSMTTSSPLAVCLTLTQALNHASTHDEIFDASLAALAQGLSVPRSAILLFDPDGKMRFKAWRGLSNAYRAAVEGHTPWTPDTPDPQPIVVPDVTRDPSLKSFLRVFVAEGIAAMAFIPLVSVGRVIGKFMLYYGRPYELADDELQLAGLIAAQVAFAVSRTRAEDATRRSEERLQFALDAASVGTWEWDLVSQAIRWSENLERLHGLPRGTLNGTFESYEAQIHPDDRERVRASVERAIAEQSLYDCEYRVVAADGAVRWVELKGLVEYIDGHARRMTGVCMISTPRKEAELARLAVAEEANRQKDDFLGVLSHELRTPLNAIVGWVQIIKRGDLRSTEQVEHAIEVIGRNARLQAQLIEDILDVTRIAAGKVEIDRQPVLVSDVLDAVLSALLPLAEAKGILVTQEICDDMPPVLGDAKRLHQALSNVIANAIKFTPEAGRVVVSCVRHERSILLTVHDSGLGIAPDVLPLVFERFWQGDSHSGPRHGGLGLGLAITRHLIEQHGGSISASSDGIGRGSIFSITLPIINP